MKVEIYIGIAWSGGSSGEWYTDYVEVPDALLDDEKGMTKYISEWIDRECIECAFWGIYNISSSMDDEEE